jgi:rhodanese-related sulfurtransferase
MQEPYNETDILDYEIDVYSLMQALLPLNNHPMLIDIRNAVELIQQPPIDTAMCIEQAKLQESIAQYCPDKNKYIVLYCSGGIRSMVTVRYLRKLGYVAAFSLKGGLAAWRDNK